MGCLFGTGTFTSFILNGLLIEKFLAFFNTLFFVLFSGLLICSLFSDKSLDSPLIRDYL